STKARMTSATSWGAAALADSAGCDGSKPRRRSSDEIGPSPIRPDSEIAAGSNGMLSPHRDSQTFTARVRFGAGRYLPRPYRTVILRRRRHTHSRDTTAHRGGRRMLRKRRGGSDGSAYSKRGRTHVDMSGGRPSGRLRNGEVHFAVVRSDTEHSS